MVRFHLLPPKKYLSGGITQLVECLLCKQNVAGSNPTTSTSMYLKHFSIFENRKLEIKENYNSYNEIGWRNPSLSEEKFLAKRIRAHDGCLGIGRL